MAVGACDNSLRTRLARDPGHQPQRGGGAEPHGINALFSNDLAHAFSGSRGREHDLLRPAKDGDGRRSVVKRCLLMILCRCENNDGLRTAGSSDSVGEIPQIRLNPAESRREVVGDQENLNGADALALSSGQRPEQASSSTARPGPEYRNRRRAQPGRHRCTCPRE